MHVQIRTYANHAYMFTNANHMKSEVTFKGADCMHIALKHQRPCGVTLFTKVHGCFQFTTPGLH
jgi:hypothetical protein